MIVVFQTKFPPPKKNRRQKNNNTAKHSKQIYQSVKPVVRLKKQKILAVNPQLNVQKEGKTKLYQQAPRTAGNKKPIDLDHMPL